MLEKKDKTPTGTEPLGGNWHDINRKNHTAVDRCHPSTEIYLYSNCLPHGHAILSFSTDASG